MKNLTFEDFLKEKGIDNASFEAKSDNESAELYASYLSTVAKNLQEAVDNGVTKDELKQLQDEQAKAIAKRDEKMNNIIKEQGAAIKSMMEKLTNQGAEGQEKSIKEHLIENKETLDQLKSGEKVNVRFTTKAVGDMSLSGNTTGQIPQAYREPGVNNVPTRRPRLLDIVTTGQIDSNLVEWVYQSGKEGTAGVTEEGAAKNQIDFDLVVGSQKVEKVTAYIKVTDEMLDDVSYMASEINNELTREVVKAAETQVYSGSGTSPQLNGIFTVASSFAAGTFAGTIDEANDVDVLTVAMNQILIAEHDPANYILMHPSDVTALKMVKVSSTDKRYVERLAMVAGDLSLDGTPIIPTTLVTAGTYLVGNFNLANVLIKDGLTIEVGYDSDDWTKNFRTVRAEWRAVCFVKNNSRTAFVKGNFANDAAALETP